MKMTKRVFKGISGMILTLVVGVGALNANAQCAADMVVLQNQSNCSSQVILEANVFGSNIQSWTFYLDGNIVGTGNSFVSLNLTPGVYIGEVAVITDQGCTAVDDTVFTVAGNPLEVDAGSDVVSCQAQTTLSVSVNSSNPYSINWYPEQYLNNSESANPIVTQNLDDQWFIVDVLDDVTGCINSDTIQVSQYGPIIEEFSLCDGPVEIDMGPGADFYEWLNYTDTAGNITSLTYPTTQQSIIVDDPGTYFIVADFAACGALTSQVVVEACTAAVCSSEFITSENVQNCGLWVDFAGTAFSSPVDSVVWNFGDGETYTDQGSGIFHEYGAGTFTATMTTYHTDGCISSSSEVFSFSNPLEVQLIEDTIACSGTLFLNQNTTGGSGNYGYSWVPSSAMNDPNAANPQMTVQNDAWVEVFVTDLQTGCTSFDYMFVYSNQAVNETLQLCSDSMQLELNPGSLVYNWSYTDSQGNSVNLSNQTNEIWVDEIGTYNCFTYQSGCNQVIHTFEVIACGTNCSSEFISAENTINCGLWVDFAGTGFSSPVDSVVWDFGDGETYTDQGSGIFHEYGAGTFTATMTTYHTDGCISSSSEVFSFSNPLEVQLIEDTIACSGTLFLNQNTTGGSGNYGYSWVPSSAMNDPNAANPQMTVQNDVWVEVFVTDVQTGCTAADYMFVYANEAVYDSVEICSDSLQLELNPGSLVYSWSYTDQFGNVSQIQNFTNEIWVDEPGVYSCITYYSGCNDVTHTFIVEECAPQNDEVWPGDANSDNIVTNADALYLGLAFNQTGPVRPAATLNWVGQPCPDWNFNFVQNNVNLKHADCDGNGIINFDDTLAIDFNYLNTHNKFEEESAAGNPPLWVEATPDTVGLEQAIDILVHLGSFEEPIDSLHGVSFSLTFDQDLLQQSNLTIDFNNCVLGTAGSDVIAFQKRFFNDGVIDLAVTRNTLQNFDGYGPIVHARIVTTDNLSGMHDLPIGISNALAITATEFEVELTTIADTVVIDPNKVGIVEPEQLDVTVYPNPTNGVVTVAGIEKGELLVLNAVGQTVLRADILSSKETLNLDHLPSGLYILHFRTERGVAAKRIRLLK